MNNNLQKTIYDLDDEISFWSRESAMHTPAPTYVVRQKYRLFRRRKNLLQFLSRFQ